MIVAVELAAKVWPVTVIVGEGELGAVLGLRVIDVETMKKLLTAVVPS